MTYVYRSPSFYNPQRVLFSSSVKSLSRVQLFVTPWTAACQASLSITNSQSLLKLMSIESVMPSNHLILCRPLLSCLQSFPASGSFPVSQFFPSGGQRIGVSASASVLPMNIQDWFLLGWTGWKFFLGVRSFLWVHTIHIASVWYQRSLNDSPSRNEPVLRLVRCRLSCSGPDRHV